MRHKLQIAGGGHLFPNLAMTIFIQTDLVFISFLLAFFLASAPLGLSLIKNHFLTTTKFIKMAKKGSEKVKWTIDWSAKE